MVDFVTGLRCRECRAPSPPRRCTSATTASGRSRWPTTTSGSRRRSAGSASRPGPDPSGATATSSPSTTRPRWTSAPASPRSCAPTGWPPSSAWASCGSRTTRPTRPDRSRTGWCRWPSPRPASSASRWPPARRPGNLANSVAAHAARAGMESVVLIPHDLEAAKVTMTAVYGGTVIAVEGTYDDVNRLCAELTSERPDWAFVNVNVRTYYAEGSKTLAFEIAEQLGWQAPDHVVVPIGSGSQLTKVAKGFAELARSGCSTGAPCGSRAPRPTGARRWPPRSCRGPTPSGRSSPRPSPSRWPSATRPTAGTPSR